MSGDALPDLKEVNYINAEKGLKSWLTTVDHKRIAILYLVMILAFFVVAMGLGFMIRLELLNPGEDFLDGAAYNRTLTLHGVIMIFLFIIPAIQAIFGNFALPIMIGANDVAFPRLNLASWYFYVAGSLLALASIAFGGVDTGWTFYVPYSAQTDAKVLWPLLAAFTLGWSSILTGLNFIVTVHRLRAPGMTWRKLPLFVWSTYATSWVAVVATPVVGITLVMVIAERFFGLPIFDVARGGDPILFQHLFWIYSHPAVYIMVLPAMGVVSEVIPVFSRKRIFGYRFIAMSSLAIAAIGSLVWAHHMFTSGMADEGRIIFSFLTFFVSVPSAVKVFNWLATMYKGSIKLDPPMLFGLAFIVLFSIGGFTGLQQAALTVDIHLHDTSFIVAHFHYTMFGGTGVMFFAALFYWWPKMFGKMYSRAGATIGFALFFIGFNTLYMPLFVAGLEGMPRRYADYLPEYHGYHQLSTYGSWIMITGLLTLIGTLIVSLFNGKKSVMNPWGAATLEWKVPSPPPTHQFDGPPDLDEHEPYKYDNVPLPTSTTVPEGTSGGDAGGYRMSEATAISGDAHDAHDHGEHVHYGIPTYDPTGAKLAMWLFLFTEVLLFGALFIAYGVYLETYTWNFSTGSSQLSVPIGGFNTVVLLTSSLTMALAIAVLQRGKKDLCLKLLKFTIGCAVLFCVIKSFEWGGKFSAGTYPGSEQMLSLPVGQQMFYTLYFTMTGLHALHVILGAGLILWAMAKVNKGTVTGERIVFLENIGLYWHLVDLIWIFLFPLFYLIA